MKSVLAEVSVVLLIILDTQYTVPTQALNPSIVCSTYGRLILHTRMVFERRLFVAGAVTELKRFAGR